MPFNTAAFIERQVQVISPDNLPMRNLRQTSKKYMGKQHEKSFVFLSE